MSTVSGKKLSLAIFTLASFSVPLSASYYIKFPPPGNRNYTYTGLSKENEVIGYMNDAGFIQSRDPKNHKKIITATFPKNSYPVGVISTGTGAPAYFLNKLKKGKKQTYIENGTIGCSINISNFDYTYTNGIALPYNRSSPWVYIYGHGADAFHKTQAFYAKINTPTICEGLFSSYIFNSSNRTESQILNIIHGPQQTWAIGLYGFNTFVYVGYNNGTTHLKVLSKYYSHRASSLAGKDRIGLLLNRNRNDSTIHLHLIQLDGHLNQQANYELNTDSGKRGFNRLGFHNGTWYIAGHYSKIPCIYSIANNYSNNTANLIEEIGNGTIPFFNLGETGEIGLVKNFQKENYATLGYLPSFNSHKKKCLHIQHLPIHNLLISHQITPSFWNANYTNETFLFLPADGSYNPKKNISDFKATSIKSDELCFDGKKSANSLASSFRDNFLGGSADATAFTWLLIATGIFIIVLTIYISRQKWNEQKLREIAANEKAKEHLRKMIQLKMEKIKKMEEGNM